MKKENIYAIVSDPFECMTVGSVRAGALCREDNIYRLN